MPDLLAIHASSRLRECMPVLLMSILLYAGGLSAQTYKIEGKVIDAHTEEPVPFANVYVEGSTIGTSTDFDGFFNISTSQKGDSLVISSVGYTPFKISFDQALNHSKLFKLDRASINIKEVVILPGENPAHVLFRKIVEHKPDNDKMFLENYKYEVYNKVEFDFDNISPELAERRLFKPFAFVFDYIDSTSEDRPYLPMFITETITDFYYRSKPGEYKEIVKASRISGVENESLSQFMGSYADVDAYENWITIFDREFTSPIADQGLNYYKYYLVDSAILDGHWSYKIQFLPKRKGDATFQGEMWVADTSFAVQQISMEIAGDANVNFVDRMSIFLEFEETESGQWMLTKDKIVVDLLKQGDRPGIIARKTTTYRDFVINDPSIDNMFGRGSNIIVLEDVLDKDEQFWIDNRHEPLSEQEAKIYEMVDTIKNTKAYNRYEALIEVLIYGYVEVGPVEFGPIFSAYSKNAVEGHRIRFGIRTSDDFSNVVRFGGYAAYGFKDETIKYGGDFIWLIDKRPRQMIKGKYRFDVNTASDHAGDFGQDNVLAGLYRRDIPQKLMLIREWEASYFREWGVGYSNMITMRNRIMDPKFPYQFQIMGDDFDSDSVSRVTTTEFELKLRYAHQEKFISEDFTRSSLGSKYPILSLKYVLGIKDILDSDYTYHKLEFQLSADFPLRPLGTMYLELTAGKVFSTLPFLLLEIPQGNETYFYNHYAYNLMNEYEFTADAYAGFKMSHHFEGFFFNKIPGIRKLKLREVLTGKVFWGYLSKENKELNKLNPVRDAYPIPYVELSAGIENILKFFRVDVVWRLTHTDGPNVAKIGIRGGASIMF